MKMIGVMVLALSAVAGFAEERIFKAGYAKADITPPLGVFMPGYFKERFAKEILDPLEAVCVAFSDGRTTAVILQLDTEAVCTVYHYKYILDYSHNLCSQ